MDLNDHMKRPAESDVEEESKEYSEQSKRRREGFSKRKGVYFHIDVIKIK